MKKTWETINGLIKPNCNNNKKSPKIVIDGSELNAEEACEAFNDFFINIGPFIAQSLQSPTASYSTFSVGNYANCFSFFDVDSRQVEDVIMNLEDKKCPVDCLPVTVLKHIASVISPVL